MTRGPLPSYLHLHPSTQDEDLECTILLSCPMHTLTTRRAQQASPSNRNSSISSFTSLDISVGQCGRAEEGRADTMTDLLWTDPTKSVWNTCFKIAYIASSGYTIYLMLNDYKPTHDPNLDTLKVQYLLAGSAALGMVFPYAYTPAEVR